MLTSKPYDSVMDEEQNIEKRLRVTNDKDERARIQRNAMEQQ